MLPEKERNVYLEGEAYFEVTKNRHKPFIVQSDAMRVRVLGTTFNFKSDKHCRIAEATLIEGEIEVKGWRAVIRLLRRSLHSISSLLFLNWKQNLSG